MLRLQTACLEEAVMQAVHVLNTVTVPMGLQSLDAEREALTTFAGGRPKHAIICCNLRIWLHVFRQLMQNSVFSCCFNCQAARMATQFGFPVPCLHSPGFQRMGTDSPSAGAGSAVSWSCQLKSALKRKPKTTRTTTTTSNHHLQPQH